MGRTVKTDRRDADQRAFLAAFAVHGVITTAAEAIDHDRDIHYRWLDEDPTYEERFEAAKEAFADQLEAEARRRAVEGVKDYVVSAGRLVYVDDPENPGTPIPLVRQVYSDTLLLAMLKAHRPDKYKDRASHEITGKDGGPVELDVVFDLDLADGGEEEPAAPQGPLPAATGLPEH